MAGRCMRRERPNHTLQATDERLDRLAAVDPEQCRFFAGLTVEETAEVMGTSTATVKREWRHVKAWLARDMKGKSGAHAAG